MTTNTTAAFVGAVENAIVNAELARDFATDPDSGRLDQVQSWEYFIEALTALKHDLETGARTPESIPGNERWASIWTDPVENFGDPAASFQDAVEETTFDYHEAAEFLEEHLVG